MCQFLARFGSRTVLYVMWRSVTNDSCIVSTRLITNAFKIFAGVCVCVCVCVLCVCLYVCKYVCRHACMYIYVYVCMYVCMYVFVVWLLISTALNRVHLILGCTRDISLALLNATYKNLKEVRTTVFCAIFSLQQINQFCEALDFQSYKFEDRGLPGCDAGNFVASYHWFGGICCLHLQSRRVILALRWGWLLPVHHPLCYLTSLSIQISLVPWKWRLRVPSQS